MVKKKRYQQAEKEFTPDQRRLVKKRRNAIWSKGEKLVHGVLKGSGMRFYQEFYFDELRVAGKMKLLFFDFYLPDYQVVIEFDGQQHYTREFNGKPIVNGERNDFLKTSFCFKRGIKLLRIKYTDIDRVEEIICEFFDKHYPNC